VQNLLGNPTSVTSSGERRGSSKILAQAVKEAMAEDSRRRSSSSLVVATNDYESAFMDDSGDSVGSSVGREGGVGGAKTSDRPAFSEKRAESERAMRSAGESTTHPNLWRNSSERSNRAHRRDSETSLSAGLIDEGDIILERVAFDEVNPKAVRCHSLGGNRSEKVSRRQSDEANRPRANRPSVIRKTSLEHARPAAFGRPQNRKTSMGSYGTNDEFDSDDVDNVIAYWVPPPPSNIQKTAAGGELLLEADEEKPLQVDFRCACFKLTNISTVDFTSVIKFVVVFEWNDPRICGLPITTNDLPGDLWGPDIILENAQNECEVVYDSFSLLSSETGRLKRTITFHGPVYNPMDLRDFPFDNDELEMKFITICNWRTLDGSRFGNDPVKRVYSLRPMLDRKDGE